MLGHSDFQLIAHYFTGPVRKRRPTNIERCFQPVLWKKVDYINNFHTMVYIIHKIYYENIFSPLLKVNIFVSVRLLFPEETEQQYTGSKINKTGTLLSVVCSSSNKLLINTDHWSTHGVIKKSTLFHILWEKKIYIFVNQAAESFFVV